MPRRFFRSLDVPTSRAVPGSGATPQTVDLRETTRSDREWERKSILLSNYYAAMGSWGVTGIPGRQWDVMRAVREGYARVVWVYKAVETIAGNQSRLTVVAKDGAHLIADHPASLLLNGTRCSQLNESGKVYRKRLSMQVLLSPRGAFTEVISSRAGTPMSYTLLPPARTRMVPATDGTIDHYEVDPLRPGDGIRHIDPDRVRWTREPHPLDPYAGMTPLEAAGLSIEMDHFARLFNRSFMANDARPGMLVGITGDDDDTGEMDPHEQARIESKFSKGPLEAGRTVVVDGKVSAIDMGGAPRDGSWMQIRVAGKDEILVAFGVPESQIGHASGATFANAAEEKESYWILTQQPHDDTIDDTWAEDALDPSIDIGFDYKGTPVVERLERENREEMRAEVQDGVRSIKSYMEKSGRYEEDEVIDSPGTRVLWIAGGVPIGDPADQDAASKVTPTGAKGTPTPQNGSNAGPPGRPTALGGAQGGTRAIGPGRAAPASFKGGVAPREHKLHVAGRTITSDDDEEDHRERDVTAGTLEALLLAISNRLTEVTIAKVKGRQGRKGTRHWTPEPGQPLSTKALDPSTVVDPDLWREQVQRAAMQVLAPAGSAAGAKLRKRLREAGVETQPTTLAPVAEQPPPDHVPPQPPAPSGHDGDVHPVLDYAIIRAVRWLAGAGQAKAQELQDRIAAAEQADIARTAVTSAPAGVDPIIDAIRTWQNGPDGDTGLSSWARTRAESATTATVQGVQHGLLVNLPVHVTVTRTWQTRKDDRVRDAHRLAEGQTVNAGESFTVGGEKLPYPGWPGGRPENVINCRCHAPYKITVPPEAKAIPFDPEKHPRGLGGRWAHVAVSSVHDMVHGSPEEHEGERNVIVQRHDADSNPTGLYRRQRIHPDYEDEVREKLPLTHLYRVVSDEDMHRMAEQGHLDTHGGGNMIRSEEGMVASIHARGLPSTYAPHDGEVGRLLKIRYEPDDGWVKHYLDGPFYAHTRHPVPFDRVEEISEPFVRDWDTYDEEGLAGYVRGDTSHPHTRLDQRLVDYKPDRVLSDPDKVTRLDELLPNARHVPYSQMPFLDELHRRMGVEDPLSIPIEDYVAKRDALFEQIPDKDTPLDKLVITQPHVNTDRVRQIRDDPATGGTKPQFLVRHGGETYVINGHHRIAAHVLDGRTSERARTLDLDSREVPGQRVTYEDLGDGSGRVIAWDPNADDPFTREHGMGMLSWNSDGKISWVQVYQEQYQRRGVAAAMLAEARKHRADISHSDEMSPSGAAWSAATAVPRKTATTSQVNDALSKAGFVRRRHPSGGFHAMQQRGDDYVVVGFAGYPDETETHGERRDVLDRAAETLRAEGFRVQVVGRSLHVHPGIETKAIGDQAEPVRSMATRIDWDPGKHPRGVHGRFSHTWQHVIHSHRVHDRRRVIADVVAGPRSSAVGGVNVDPVTHKITVTPDPMPEMAKVRPGRAYKGAVDDARAKLPDNPAHIGRRVETALDNPETRRLQPKIDHQQAQIDKWQQAVDSGIDPNTGEKMPDVQERWDEERGTYIPSLVDAVAHRDSAVSIRDQLTAKRDEYVEFIRKNRGDAEVVGPDMAVDGGPAETAQEHLATVLSAGKALDREAQRRIKARVDAAGVDERSIEARRRAALDEQLAWTEKIYENVLPQRRAEWLQREHGMTRQQLDQRLAELGASDIDVDNPEYARLQQIKRAWADIDITEAEAEEEIRLHEQISDALDATRDAEAMRKAIARDTYLEVLREVRPMGPGDTGGVRFRAQTEARKRASDMVVGDKIDGGDNVGPLEIIDIEQMTVPSGHGEARRFRVRWPDGREMNTGLYALAETVPVHTGGEPTAEDVERAAAVVHAQEFYPTDWIEASNAAGTFDVIDAKDSELAGRGFYRHNGAIGSPPLLALSATTRPLPGGTGMSDRVATHELGHRMEYTVDGITEMEWALQWKRTSQQTSGVIGPARRIRERPGDQLTTIYGDIREQARPDKYPEAYTGKEYEGKPDGPWEILTTQMESLFAGSEHDDPELRAWTLGVLATVGRKVAP